MADPFKAAIAVLGLLLVVLLGAWLLVRRTDPPSSSTQKTDPQDTTAPGPTSRPATPGLDAAAPAKTETAGTETATFALG